MPIALENSDALASSVSDAPVGTGSRGTRLLGAATLLGLIVLLVFAFALSEPDERVDPETNLVTGMFDAVRLFYVHLPLIIGAYVAFIITGFGSIMVLSKRSIWWDIVAAAAAEIGVIFASLGIVTGSIWSRPVWNTWWEWGDVRVMTTLLLVLVYVGYLAYRRSVAVAEVRARRSAVLGVMGLVLIPIINRSVEWWENRTLHQKSTLAELKIEDLTLFTLMLGFAVAAMVLAWLLIHRFRLGWLEHQQETVGLEAAIAERRAQADGVIDEAVDHPGLTDASRRNREDLR